MYRNQVCGGGISFLHAWVFTVFMYMFAALLAAVAHYIYFRFIDHGYVLNTCETMVDTLAQSNMPGMDSYIATYQEALETARLLSPIDITHSVSPMKRKSKKGTDSPTGKSMNFNIQKPPI